jgi:hypothetical protein
MIISFADLNSCLAHLISYLAPLILIILASFLVHMFLVSDLIVTSASHLETQEYLRKIISSLPPLYPLMNRSIKEGTHKFFLMILTSQIFSSTNQ